MRVRDSPQGFIVIPKSTKKSRIVDNANVFDFKLEKADVDVPQCFSLHSFAVLTFRTALQRLTSLDEFLITDWGSYCLLRPPFALLLTCNFHHRGLHRALEAPRQQSYRMEQKAKLLHPSFLRFCCFSFDSTLALKSTRESQETAKERRTTCASIHCVLLTA
jgi:hypothetical protein